MKCDLLIVEGNRFTISNALATFHAVSGVNFLTLKSLSFPHGVANHGLPGVE
jgi:hypothetical protein